MVSMSIIGKTTFTTVYKSHTHWLDHKRGVHSCTLTSYTGFSFSFINFVHVTECTLFRIGNRRKLVVSEQKKKDSLPPNNCCVSNAIMNVGRLTWAITARDSSQLTQAELRQQEVHIQARASMQQIRTAVSW